MDGTAKASGNTRSASGREVKVLGYVTRLFNERQQLLICLQPEKPADGWQVVAGTVEAGETPEGTMLRELKEETGLKGFRIVARFAEVENPRENYVRHLFHLHAPPHARDSWEYTGTGHGPDSGRKFRYKFVDLDSAPTELSEEHARWLSLL